MAIEEEDVRRPAQISVPRPLAGLSIEELEAWIAVLRAEIGRVEVELTQRRDVRGAADALFKKPPGA